MGLLYLIRSGKRRISGQKILRLYITFHGTGLNLCPFAFHAENLTSCVVRHLAHDICISACRCTDVEIALNIRHTEIGISVSARRLLCGILLCTLCLLLCALRLCKFVLRLCLTSFCICGMVVFLSFSTGLERSLL